MDLKNLCAVAELAALKASEQIKSIKHPLITHKPDGSVLSSADLQSNEIICRELLATNIPICSEEALLSFKERQNAPYFWLIDPLDGTSNYLKSRKEYCICIALICKNRPVIGVILDVENNQLYSGFQGGGVKKNGEIFRPGANFSHKAALSLRKRSHRLNYDFALTHDLEPFQIGSALKFIAVLECWADVYARFDTLNSWDIAAGDFLINEAGALMIGLDHKMIDYNQENFICAPFIATSLAFERKENEH